MKRTHNNIYMHRRYTVQQLNGLIKAEEKELERNQQKCWECRKHLYGEDPSFASKCWHTLLRGYEKWAANSQWKLHELRLALAAKQ